MFTTSDNTSHTQMPGGQYEKWTTARVKRSHIRPGIVPPAPGILRPRSSEPSLRPASTGSPAPASSLLHVGANGHEYCQCYYTTL
ncbi:unnamed protein product [Parnassius apollo]|uniref:(apollo) hypothetical protein n=1 Tax=Parnassius apollo TaxID=110799 RepID=A0A8S3XT14_PARAO|nr:unnamed protein product [Parnassius apollo]